MARINRTITVRSSRTLIGRLFFLIACFSSLTGLIKGFRMLAFTGLLCLLLITGRWLLRKLTVISLDSQGISYASPFKKVRLSWAEVQTAGVYYIRNGEVCRIPPDATIPDLHHVPRKIFVSTNTDYSPCHDRRISDTCIHFRWSYDAWRVISAHTGKQAHAA